jgi:hypothetical protein
MRIREARAVVQCRNEAQTRHRTDSGNRHQALADGVLLGKFLEFLVGRSNPLVESFDRLQQAFHVFRKAVGSTADRS